MRSRKVTHGVGTNASFACKLTLRHLLFSQNFIQRTNNLHNGLPFFLNTVIWCLPGGGNTWVSIYTTYRACRNPTFLSRLWYGVPMGWLRDNRFLSCFPLSLKPTPPFSAYCDMIVARWGTYGVSSCGGSFLLVGFASNPTFSIFPILSARQQTTTIKPLILESLFKASHTPCSPLFLSQCYLCIT